jgi:hypothetical protein
VLETLGSIAVGVTINYTNEILHYRVSKSDIDHLENQT